MVLGVRVSARTWPTRMRQPRSGVLCTVEDDRNRSENRHIGNADEAGKVGTPSHAPFTVTLMPRTYAKNLVHCVYGTKNCVNLIREPQRVLNMTREIARNISIDIIAIGGVDNHIHLLMTLPPARAMANVVRDLKANSSQILRRENRMFRWQDGYAAISVSPSAVRNVVRYIEHQAKHHHARSFQDEYIAMLDRAGIAYDARYVWD